MADNPRRIVLVVGDEERGRSSQTMIRLRELLRESANVIAIRSLPELAPDNSRNALRLAVDALNAQPLVLFHPPKNPRPRPPVPKRRRKKR